MKTNVWTITIRIFHWLLAFGFATAFILGDFDKYQNLHYAFGLFVGALLLFRVFYGIIGPKYANFKDFPISIKAQIDFATHFLKKDKTYTGHNPAASVVMLSIFLVGILCSVSGFMLYSIENNPLMNINLSEGFVEGAHKLFAILFLILVGIHLVGLFTDLLFHAHTKTLQSIFTGYKSVEGENTKQSGFHIIYSFLWIIVPLFALIYGYNLKSGHKAEKNKTEQHEKDKGHDEHEEDEH
jgi:cytochrome b